MRPNTILSAKTASLGRLALLAAMTLWLVACDSDLKTDTLEGAPAEPIVAPPGEGQAANDELTLQVGNGAVSLIEGADAIRVPITVTRTSATPRPVTLVAQGQTATDELQMSWQFDDAVLAADESSTDLVLQLGIASRPINVQNRTFQILANDGGSPSLVVAFNIQVQPTPLDDVYLLIGQSNTIGFSEDGSKQTLPGQPDAPVSRIQQLNVTGNDDKNFPTAADFTDPDSSYNTGAPISIAVDPLHDGFDSRINGKVGSRIGYGLSFAKAALNNTTANILLVPAAWSDTGFCKRKTNRLPGIGWNATEKFDEAFSGTLLHDRAIVRTNIALEQTGGILRGILWHQGEADSDEQSCAETYAANLAELVTSLRTTINVDARGAIARGPNADVPFIVGTMSKGSDERGDQLPFNDSKALVDAAHRNIANLVPLATFVNNDDLVPPAFPCGEGSCIHYGALAQREMGQRYYNRLRELLP